MEEQGKILFLFVLFLISFGGDFFWGGCCKGEEQIYGETGK